MSSVSLWVCVFKKRKAQQKPLQGGLITPRKRGNINGRFCGYNVTAKRLQQPQHVKWSHSRCVCARVASFLQHMPRSWKCARNSTSFIFCGLCLWIMMLVQGYLISNSSHGFTCSVSVRLKTLSTHVCVYSPEHYLLWMRFMILMSLSIYRHTICWCKLRSFWDFPCKMSVVLLKKI